MFWPKRNTKLSEKLNICQLTVYLFIFEMRPLHTGQTSLKLMILLTVGMYTCISIDEKKIDAKHKGYSIVLVTDESNS